MEITFEAIKESDELIIQTQNSEYRFFILDPNERRGILSGGTLGEQKRDAILIGSLCATTNLLACEPSVLKSGSRALFYLSAKSGAERLITSVITRIRNKGNRNGEKLVA